VAPVDGNQMCKILSHQAPEKNVLVSVSVLGLCGRDLKPTDELWTPGTLNFLNVEDSLDYHRGWAQAVAGMLPGPTKVAVVSGPPLLTSSRTTERSFQEVRKTRPDLEIAATVRTDLTTPDALAKVQTLLQGNPDIDAILSIHPDITRGVIQALKARGKQPGDVKLFDFGASRYDVEQIKAGWLTATTIYRPRTTTEQQVKSIVDAFAGRPVQRVMPVVEPGTADRPHMLTKDNVDGFRPEW
jgi:ribose transport system substrate-binding protein